MTDLWLSGVFLSSK